MSTSTPTPTPTGTKYRRRIDWSARMNSLLTDLRSRESLTFNWDPHKEDSLNCFTFAGVACDAMFGVNPYNVLGSKESYADPVEAIMALKAVGFRDMQEVMEALFTRRDINYVQRGDFLLLPAQNYEHVAVRWAVALADPPNFWVMSEAHGLSRGFLRSSGVRTAFSTETLSMPTSAPDV